MNGIGTNSVPWEYKHNSTLQIIEVVYSGRITARDLRESTSELIALEKDKGINKFLVDTSAMNLAASLMDVYELPEKQYLDENADRRGLVALLLPISQREKEVARFYETDCKNRGWNVQTFSNRDDAVGWLNRNVSSK